MIQPRASHAPPELRTFLMTDIEGSARLWDEEPEQMGRALAQHDALIEDCVARFGGRVIKSKGEGDSTLSVFSDTIEAIEAALLLQRRIASYDWPVARPLAVRAAIETGEAEARDDDFFGPTLNRCARVRGAAHGGQILVSDATAAFLSQRSAAGFSLVDLGFYRLKGLKKELRVFQICAPKLVREFPPLRALDIRVHNLPEEVATSIDRSQDIESVMTMLESSRLVTLWGTGGAGKTHLSLQIARRSVERFKDGVWFIELAATTDPALVAERVAAVLGISKPDSIQTPTDLAVALRDRELLLVLDNCEHLLGAAREVTSALLAGGGGMRVMVTSREPLGLAGESVHRVGGLSLSASGPSADHAQAVQLFISRARSAAPDVDLDDDNAIEAVERICRRVEGLPLAIELAAGALTALDIGTLVGQLDARFDVLDAIGGSTGERAGRTTMSGAINWSYSLATVEQRRALRMLSMFAGSFSLEAAVKVAETDVASLLALVRQSLVTQDAGAGRYRLLEPVRYFARTLLVDADEFERATASFLAWMGEVTVCPPPVQPQWLNMLELELDNLRGALQLAEASDPDALAALVHSSAPFWKLRGHLREGRDWIEMALARGHDLPSEVQGWLHAHLGHLAFWLGDQDTSTQSSRTAVVIAREMGLLDLQASALNVLGLASEALGRIAEARDYYRSAADAAREASNEVLEANALSNLGIIALQVDKDLETARRHYEQSLALRRHIGDVHGTGISLSNLGEISELEGDIARGLELLHEALEVFLGLGDPYMAAMTVAEIALLISKVDPQRAATCLGAAESVLALLDIAEPEFEASDARTRAALVATLGEERFAELYAGGLAMSLEDAGAHARRYVHPE